MNQTRPKKNLTESILARAELFRRNMLFDGVPTTQPDLQMPAAPVANAVPTDAQPAGAAEAAGAAAPANPMVTDALVSGAVEGQSPIQTILAPQ